MAVTCHPTQPFAFYLYPQIAQQKSEDFVGYLIEQFRGEHRIAVLCACTICGAAWIVALFSWCHGLLGYELYVASSSGRVSQSVVGNGSGTGDKLR